MANFLSKIIDFFKKLFTRPGMNIFLEKYLPTAFEVVSKLALVNNNAEFDKWKDTAFDEIKRITGEIKGTWISILIHLAYENLKARKG